MIYTLYIWAVIAMAGDRHYAHREYSWQVLGEFYDGTAQNGALDRCEAAAQKLGLKQYRCVRSM